MDMQLDKETDDIAILALMMVGVVVERLNEIGQLDPKTTRHLHHLVKSARTHAQFQSGHELDNLFNRIEDKLGKVGATGAG
jgi:hypothetical protein